MKLLEKILFATDFSPAANAVLNSVKKVARTFDSQVVLLHVVPELSESLIKKQLLLETAQTELQRIFFWLFCIYMAQGYINCD